MGLFDKAKQAKQSAADAMAQAGAMQQSAPGGFGTADMPGMGGQDMAAMAAYSAKVNKLAQSGLEAPGVIHTVTAAGTPDVSGATMHAVRGDLPAPRAPTRSRPRSSRACCRSSSRDSPRDSPCTVKYDPDKPSAAVLQSW